MDRVDRLLEQYAESARAGEADPTPFLDQVEGQERDRLERRIELFYVASPAEEFETPRAWDPAEFRGSLAERIVEELVEETRCPAGEWPDLLPELMAERELEREVVVERLAAGIGAEAPGQVEKVGEYFHDMTWGTLDARGVTDTVLDRLAEILGTSRDALRRAGEAIGKRRPGGTSSAVFARRPSIEELNLGGTDSPPSGEMRTPSAKPDEIDLLFISRRPDRAGE
jgi:hypothetical protein